MRGRNRDDAHPGGGESRGRFGRQGRGRRDQRHVVAGRRRAEEVKRNDVGPRGRREGEAVFYEDETGHPFIP
jgi:hypothetical protein